MADNFDIERIKMEFEAEFDKRATTIRESHAKFQKENQDYLKLRLGDFDERADDLKLETYKFHTNKGHFTKEHDMTLKICNDLKIKVDSVQTTENSNYKQYKDSIRGKIEDLEKILKTEPHNAESCQDCFKSQS